MPKTCSRCGIEKPLREFYKQVGGAQGRRGACKECYRAAERASRARHPKVSIAGGKSSSGDARKACRAFEPPREARN